MELNFLQNSLKETEKIDLEALLPEILDFAKQEQKSVDKLKQKVKNEEFSFEDLDAQDVSTLFSLFKLDALFPAMQETKTTLEEILLSPIELVQKKFCISFAAAADLQFKMKLLENKELSPENHLNNCSICSTKNVFLLLLEYGLKLEEKDKKEMHKKIGEWRGYFFATVNPVSGVAFLEVPPSLSTKFTQALVRIQKAHNWQIL